jgi:hypothetical protein
MGDGDDESDVGDTSARKPFRGRSGTISGISSDAEYRRTIGALFAIYWLMRIGIDGESPRLTHATHLHCNLDCVLCPLLTVACGLCVPL